MTSAGAAYYIEELEKEVIEDPPTSFFMDLRALGFTWYDRLHLKNSDEITYLVVASFHDYARGKSNEHNKIGPANKKRVSIYIPAFDEYIHKCSKHWMNCWAYRQELKQGEVLVDAQFLLKHPNILGSGHPMMLRYKAEISESEKSSLRRSPRLHSV